MENKDLTKRVFSGIGATILNQIVNFLFQFACIGIFVKYWGQTYYGEWLIIYSFSQYLTMGDVGISATLSNKITSLIEIKDYQQANKWFVNGWLILTIFSFFVFVGIFITIILFQKNSFHLINNHDLISCLCFILFYVIVFLQTNLLNSIYIAGLKFAKQKNIDSFAKIFEFCTILTCLVFNGNAIVVAFSMFLCRLLVLIYVIFDIKRCFSWLSFELYSVQKDIVLLIIKPALANMFLNVGYLMYYNGPIIIIGNFLGSAMVSKFYTISTILRATKQIPLLINLPLYPEYARLIETKNIIGAKKLHKTAIYSTFFLALSTTLFVYFFSDRILSLLFKDKLLVIPSPFFEISLFALLIQCLWHASQAVLVGGNRHIKSATHYLLASLLGYILIFCLIGRFQLNAIAIGLLVIDCIMIVSTFYQVFNLLNESFMFFLKVDFIKIYKQYRLLFIKKTNL